MKIIMVTCPPLKMRLTLYACLIVKYSTEDLRLINAIANKKGIVKFIYSPFYFLLNIQIYFK